MQNLWSRLIFTFRCLFGFFFLPIYFHGLLEGRSSRFSLSSIEFSTGPTLKQRVEMPLHSEKHVSKKTTLSCWFLNNQTSNYFSAHLPLLWVQFEINLKSILPLNGWVKRRVKWRQALGEFIPSYSFLLRINLTKEPSNEVKG